LDYDPSRPSDQYALINKWILGKLYTTVLNVNKSIDEYEFGYAT